MGVDRRAPEVAQPQVDEEVELKKDGAIEIKEDEEIVIEENEEIKTQEDGGIESQGKGAIKIQENGEIDTQENGEIKTQGNGGFNIQVKEIYDPLEVFFAENMYQGSYKTPEEDPYAREIPFEIKLGCDRDLSRAWRKVCNLYT